MRRQSCAAAVGVVELDVRTGRGRALREGIRGRQADGWYEDIIRVFLVVYRLLWSKIQIRSLNFAWGVTPVHKLLKCVITMPKLNLGPKQPISARSAIVVMQLGPRSAYSLGDYSYSPIDRRSRVTVRVPREFATAVAAAAAAALCLATNADQAEQEPRKLGPGDQRRSTVQHGCASATQRATAARVL